MGWIVLAPFSGTLNWRPHIWLTGRAGSGKSTVLRDIIQKLVPIAEYFEGQSSAAGVRQVMRNDARPVLFDEAERTDAASQSRLNDLVELIVTASSAEGRIAKGGASQVAIKTIMRAAFWLASVNQPSSARRCAGGLRRWSY
jgi:putative DNA primase/helicase